MRAFLGSVLGIIAVGVMLIAYGLLAPRAGAVSSPQGAPVMYDAQTGTYQLARPMFASEQLQLGPDGRVYASPGYVDRGAVAPNVVTYPATYPAAVARPVRTSSVAPAPAPRRTTAARATTAARETVDRGRDWKKTAMVIGGTSAAGAGLGAIFGGKKGAAIGAAIGGGAATIYEVRKR